MREWRRTAYALGAVLGVGLAAHLGALDGTFHYDDTFTVVDNPSIRRWDPVAYFASPAAGSSWVDGGAYRPLTVTSYALNYGWGRLNPMGYLAVNLFLQLLAAWMVFFLGRHLLGSDAWATIAALLFAVHPVNAEAVNYVTARSSLLSAVLAMIACLAFLHWWQGRGLGWMWASLGSFAAAMLSKESGIAVVLPIVAYGLLFPRGAGSGTGPEQPLTRRLWGLAPFVAAAMVYLVVLRMVGGGQATSAGGAAHPLWAFLEMVGRSILLWVWPFPLGLDHPVVFATRMAPVTGMVLVAAAAGAAAAAWRVRRSNPVVSWTLIWIVAGLLPLLPLPWMTTRGLLQENRIVFAAAGLAWLSAAGVRAGWDALIARGLDARTAQRIGLVGLTGLLVFGVGADRWRSSVWGTDRALWEEAVRIAPEYPVAHVNLGSTYLDLGDYDRAEAAFRDALHLDPDHATAYYNLGLLTLRQARHAESRTFLQNAISRNPGYAKAYRALGTLEMAAGRPQAAAAALKNAVALNPGDATTYAEIGRLAQQAGSPDMAEAYYREALRHDPSNSDVLNALGVLYLDHRRLGDALDQFAAALQTDPGYLEAAYNRAVTLFRLGRREEAREAAERLLPLIPAGQQYESFRRTAQAILGNGPKQGLEQNSPGTTGPAEANP